MATLEDLFNPDGSEKGGAGSTPVTGRAGATHTPAARGSGPARVGGLKVMGVPAALPAAPLPPPPAPIVVVAPPLPPPPPAREAITVEDLCTPPCAYLKGQAGSGKTYLARQIIQARSDAILVATTGIAAINLGDSTTINALLGYFDTQSLWESYASGWLSARLRKLRKSGIRILVLDEVSMLPADQLTVLCQALDDVNLTKAYDQSLEAVEMVSEEDQVMKLILVGDFAQLPPVKAKFAFESPEWSRFAASTFTLSTIHRQAEGGFVEALQAVRKGNARRALEILEGRLTPTLDFRFQGTTIVATNLEVDRINALRHGQLAGAMLSWPTVRSGEQQKDWLRLLPEAVEVKVGALVMVLANHSLGWDEEGMPQGYAYVNGDLGTVEGKEKDGIRVKLQRTGESTLIHPMTSEWREPTGKKNPAYTVKGAVTRMPLRLAWATTTYKAQGLSLDNVQVSMASWMFAKGGMLYVALSRARTLEGLRLVGNAKMFLGKCGVDPRIKDYL